MRRMGRQPCCDNGVKKGAWTPEEDKILVDYITKNGHGTWRSVPQNSGLRRCGKSCRLRWTNYLRSDIKRGPFTPEEENTIIRLHGELGNRWASIASHLEGRTDNEIKNFWNTHLRKKLHKTQKADLLTGQPSFSSSKAMEFKTESPSTSHMVQWESARVEAETRFSLTSSLAYPSPKVEPRSDYFLKLWNSEVGGSFKKIRKEAEMTFQEPKQEITSPSKIESDSVITTHAEGAGATLTLCDMADNVKKTLLDTPDNEKDMVGSISSNSYELDSCSDAALDLLLDIPGGNYMDFLQDDTYDVSLYLQNLM